MTDLPLAAAPVVAVVERSGFIESVHHGVVAAVDAEGASLLEAGPVGTPTFPRSSNKPMQALAMVRNGLDLEPELLALACASHNGEPFHLEGARRILAGAGMTEASLQNTPDRPIYEPERRRWIQQGLEPTSLAQNCSGKHSAMLATCVAAGWDTTTYRDPNHPLQRAIAATIAELTGEEVTATGIDGCGAPVHAVSPAGVARAFGRIASAPEGSDEARVADAIRGNPAWLGGSGRDVTTLIEGVPGLIAKDGAEGYCAVGLADGRGLAIKIADGSSRARTVVVVAALRRLGLTDPVLDILTADPVLGHGEPVGAVLAIDW